MIIAASIAAATAVVDYDLLTNQPGKATGNHRVITGVSLLGSAAAGDTIVDLKVGETRVARLYNRTTGFPNMDDMRPLESMVPAGEPVSAIVADAPATNAINVEVKVEDLT